MAPGAPSSAVNAKYDQPPNYNNSTTNANNNNNNNGAGGYISGGYGDVSSLPEARAVPVYEGSSPDDPYNARGASAAAAARVSSTSTAAIALANSSGRVDAPGPYPSATAAPAAPATAPIYPSFGAPPVQQPYGGQRREQNYTTNPNHW